MLKKRKGKHNTLGCMCFDNKGIDCFIVPGRGEQKAICPKCNIRYSFQPESMKYSQYEGFYKCGNCSNIFPEFMCYGHINIDLDRYLIIIKYLSNEL